MRKDLTKEKVVEVCNRSESMAKAAVELKAHINTLTRLAKKYGCYKPNKGLKGCKKPIQEKIKTEDILSGKHPEFQTYKLKNRLIKSGILNNECSECKIKDWNGKPLNMELDHIDGNRHNHRLSNLRLLCPNCHAQTDTYRSKNKPNKDKAYL